MARGNPFIIVSRSKLHGPYWETGQYAVILSCKSNKFAPYLNVSSSIFFQRNIFCIFFINDIVNVARCICWFGKFEILQSAQILPYTNDINSFSMLRDSKLVRRDNCFLYIVAKFIMQPAVDDLPCISMVVSFQICNIL